MHFILHSSFYHIAVFMNFFHNFNMINQRLLRLQLILKMLKEKRKVIIFNEQMYANKFFLLLNINAHVLFFTNQF